MGTPSHMQSVADRNIITWGMTVYVTARLNPVGLTFILRSYQIIAPPLSKMPKVNSNEEWVIFTPTVIRHPASCVLGQLWMWEAHCPRLGGPVMEAKRATKGERKAVPWKQEGNENHQSVKYNRTQLHSPIWKQVRGSRPQEGPGNTQPSCRVLPEAQNPEGARFCPKFHAELVNSELR